MKNISNTLTILLAAAFAASLPAHADPGVDTACETTEFFPEWAEASPELPFMAFRLEILPVAGRRPGNFVATITKRSTASIRMLRPTRACRLELTSDECPAIADVAQAIEQLTIPIGKTYAAPLERITLHAPSYRLQVRGTNGERHSVSYNDPDNPIADFMHDARERLLTCVPQAIQDFVDPPTGL